MSAVGVLGWLRALPHRDWAWDAACLDAALVLLAQPPREPGHGPEACSPGVGEEGLSSQALRTLVSRDATTGPPHHPRLLGCTQPRLSPPTGINSLRCYIKCFNKSLIYHTSCLLSIDSFSNFTQKRQ